MATQTAKYWYCSGSTQTFVTVTMSYIDDCPYYDFSTYDGDSRRRYMKDIRFQLSKSLSFGLPVRFLVNFSQTVDYGTPTTGTQTYVVTIPPNTTDIYYSTLYGEPFKCREERWLSAGSTTYTYPVAV